MGSLNRKLPPADHRSFVGVRRSAFTLFELILAIALSIALLALIGTAINLYLLQVDAGRSRIEEAQLARSVLAMIADDLRATSIYKPQDTAGVASLVAASSQFDVDSLDSENPQGGGGGGGEGGGGTGGSSFSGGVGSTTGPGTTGGSSSLGGSAGGGTGAENDLTMPLGVNGTLAELYVDVEQIPQLDELFKSYSGYSNTQQPTTPMGAVPPMRPSPVKTVRYFVREGRALAPGEIGATSLDPNAQLEIGGLVRQEIPRPARVWAEQSGDQTVLESGQMLVAPEVAYIEFHYLDSTLGQVIDYWDMTEKQILPPAIEVRLWIRPANADPASVSMTDLTSIMATCHEYRQIVYVPNSALCAADAGALAGGATGDSSMSTGGSSSTTGGSSMSGTGSSFDE